MTKPDLNVVKAALYTALWTFLGLFIPAGTGWLSSVAEWISKSGHTQFPGISTLGQAAFAAAGAAFAGLVAFLARYAQQLFPSLPGARPKFLPKPKPQDGRATPLALLVVVMVAVVCLLLLVGAVVWAAVVLASAAGVLWQVYRIERRDQLRVR